MATSSLVRMCSFIRESKPSSSFSSLRLKSNPVLKAIPNQVAIRSINKTPLTFISLSECSRASAFRTKCVKTEAAGGLGELLVKRIAEGMTEGIVEILAKFLTAMFLGVLLVYALRRRSYSSESLSPTSSFACISRRPSYVMEDSSSSSSTALGYGLCLLIGSTFGLWGSMILMCSLWVNSRKVRREGRLLKKATVLKLQVAVLAKARKLQTDLALIAGIADSSEGWRCVLRETSLALFRNTDSCVRSYLSVDVKQNVEDGEKRFNVLSFEERGKFDEETRVNLDNIKTQSTTSMRVDRLDDEYIVITLLVAAEGVHTLPHIYAIADLKDALQTLGSIPSSRTLAVEVFWTPQSIFDTLTQGELAEYYSHLRPLE